MGTVASFADRSSDASSTLLQPPAASCMRSITVIEI